MAPSRGAGQASSAAAAAPAIRGDFLHEVLASTPIDTRLDHCIQCGTCAGSCPAASDMDYGPQQLFAMIRAGLRDDVLHSTTPWMCIACQTCVVRCPQAVAIPEVMLGLKALTEAAGAVRSTPAIDFSRTFVANIHRYGRSYEVGLVAWHYLRHYPLRLPAMAPVGIGMLARRRMRLGIHRIRERRQLRAILERARQLEAES
ncbi:MAG TPA: 4Fe-4S dicluster domain-containing protein [Candidatus Binatus sp.]|nr:4Fe-4S dicluster domain-containing protein [Candidatus Binatus sp.]